MTDADDLLEELRAELEDGSKTLGELFQEAVQDPESAPEVVTELFREAGETSLTLGELFTDAGADLFEEFTDGDLQLVDEELFLDFEDGQLPLDPTDEEFARQLDVFGFGEAFGFVPSKDE